MADTVTFTLIQCNTIIDVASYDFDTLYELDSIINLKKNYDKKITDIKAQICSTLGREISCQELKNFYADLELSVSIRANNHVVMNDYVGTEIKLKKIKKDIIHAKERCYGCYDHQ